LILLRAILEQTPTALSPLLFDFSSRIPLLSRFKLPQTFHFLEDVFEQIFPANDVEVAADLGVFAREAIDFGLRKAAA
jgi:hypothetical protein